ncbi:protein TIFY 4A-like isoform X2 [Alnus glutinosa]|uniref:protein TIFY 4A-like isoform X2 n=1 Tax=Alnus glutinosa TaxID=3517 RepID=UPI002D7766F3|nr:protein TIFY 4A-like isoform X2 [Alnus glutinosa]
MNAATTSFRSILDKPLNQLTEEDISQLTREDCRKYLKDKGMRRPSWNKSQAIQQVISLKALLEPSDDDSGAGALRRAVVSLPRVTSNSVDSVKEPSPDVQVSVSAEESHGRKDTPISAPAGDRPAEIENNAISPRIPCGTNGSIGQMTIFYCGKVNVYDGVPPEKARAIMHLAASPVRLPQDDTLGRAASLWSLPCHLQTASEKDRLIPPSNTVAQIMQAEKMTEYSEQYREKGNTSRDPEGQANRKVSLQRYREKRKDRGRIKIKRSMGSMTGLETYLNHQVRTHTPNGKSSRSNTSSPPQHGLPQALSSSVDNQLKSAALAVDLNDKDVQEC